MRPFKTACAMATLPYPPGIFCVVPEIQGVYLEKEKGVTKAYGYVLDRE